jgi:hypothetical protein
VGKHLASHSWEESIHRGRLLAVDPNEIALNLMKEGISCIASPWA